MSFGASWAWAVPRTVSSSTSGSLMAVPPGFEGRQGRYRWIALCGESTGRRRPRGRRRPGPFYLLRSARRLELLHDLVEAEARRLLQRRVLPERRQELADVSLRRHQQVGAVDQPVVIGVRRE